MFNEILEAGSYVEFKNYCEDNDFIIEESIENDSYIFSVTKSDENSNILINGIVTADEIKLYITDEEGNVIDEMSEKYDNDAELLSYLKGALVTSKLLGGDTGFIDSDSDDILTEDEETSESGYTTIPGGLEEIKNKVQQIGDELKELSGLSNSLEIISIITELSNSAYAFALDIDGSIESYNEIMEVPPDDEELEVSDEEE